MSHCTPEVGLKETRFAHTRKKLLASQLEWPVWQECWGKYACNTVGVWIEQWKAETLHLLGSTSRTHQLPSSDMIDEGVGMSLLYLSMKCFREAFQSVAFFL